MLGVVIGQYAWIPIQGLLDNVDVTATVHLYNSKGKVIAKRSSDSFDDEQLKPFRTNPAWKTLPDGKAYAVLASSHGPGAWLAVASPIEAEGWTLRLEMPLKVMFAPITKFAWNTGLLVFAMLLVMGGLFAILVRLFIRPLGELVEGVRQVELGRFDQKVTVRSRDEFGELAGRFNTMVEKLQTTRDELVRKESSLQLAKDLAERTAAEHELHSANEQLSVLLDSLPIAVYRCAAEGEYAVEYMSQNVFSFTGYTAQNFMDQHGLWFSHIHPDDASKVSYEMELLFEKGRHAYEYRWRKADGSYLWIRDSLRLVRLEDDTPDYLVGMWQDITERKQAIQALEESESRFRAILDATMDGILVVETQSQAVIMGNRAICDMMGYEREEFLRLSFADLTTAAALPEVQRQFACQAKGDISMSPELPVQRKDGSIFFVDVSGGPPMLLGGRSVMVGVVHDITERKQAADALRQSEEKFRSLVETTSDLIWEADSNGHFIYVNPRSEVLLGYKPEEVLGRSPFDFMPPDEVQRLSKFFSKTVAKRAPYIALKNRTLHKDGRVVILEMSGIPFFDDNGGFAGYRGIGRDITESTLAEEKIREQQELTTRIIETIPLRVFWKDRDLRFLGSNTLFAKDAGVGRPEQLIGKTDFDLSWRDNAEIYRVDDQRVIDSDTPSLSVEEPQITPTGERTWIRTSKVPLHDDAGEVFGLLGTYENVTRQVEAQKQLELNNVILRAQQEMSPDAILVVDNKGKTAFYNRRFVDLWKVPEQLVRSGENEAVLKIVMEQMPDPEAFLARIRYLYKHQKEKDHEELQLKDGRVIDRYSSPALGSDGKYFGRVSYFRDISERKQAEKQILTLNKELESKVKARTQQLLDAQEELVRKEKLALLGQVAGSVGHELRNPLAVMNNAVYFLQTVSADADENTREYLGIIKAGIDDAERIVADLLDSVRTRPPRQAAVSVGQLIDQTLRTLTMTSTIAVTLDLPETLSLVWVDAMQIQQVFRNLIRNGVEAMPEGGTLAINAAENSQDGTVNVSVRDTGCGMPREVLATLFQPLITTKPRGIGLGLVVVRNLTEVNGGTIMVESSVGRGTTFTVVLPTGNSSIKES